jgi:hypothetical protein
MPSSNLFRFVLIPADISKPLEERQADGSGGIENDALIAHARSYFAEAMAKDPVGHNDQDPEIRRQMAQQIRQQLAGAAAGAAGDAAPGRVDQLLSLQDDQLLEMFQSASGRGSSCDITALTVPTERNCHTAVSLYARDPSSFGSSSSSVAGEMNVRATRIAAACGHVGSTAIVGDAFIGRAHDDERADVWERIDFPLQDADPGAEWCRVACGPGGGGGSGSSRSNRSLSSLVSNAMGSSPSLSPAAIVDGKNNAVSPRSKDELFGTNGASVREIWGSWTQTPEEVELKFALDDAGVTSKQVTATFGRNLVKIVVKGIILLEGRPFDSVLTDECTYTLQTTREGARELYVTLAKAQEGRMWSYTVQS